MEGGVQNGEVSWEKMLRGERERSGVMVIKCGERKGKATEWRSVGKEKAVE